jgi:hypothetical protein
MNIVPPALQHQCLIPIYIFSRGWKGAQLETRKP